MSIHFLGLDKEQWDFINAFANWISAFGTVGAVIVSLWLALRPDRISLNVSASIRVVIVPGVAAPPVRYVTIAAVNRGRRLAKITGIGWVYGGRLARNRKHLLQLPGERDGMSSPIPVVLDDGQQAQWMFDKTQWLCGLDKLHSADWRSTVDTFMVEVSTSVGRVFQVRIEQSLKEALITAFQEMDKASLVDPAVNS